MDSKYFKDIYNLNSLYKSSIYDFDIPVGIDQLILNEILYEIKIPVDIILIDNNPLPKLFSDVHVFIDDKLVEYRKHLDIISTLFTIIDKDPDTLNLHKQNSSVKYNIFKGRLGDLGLSTFNSSDDNKIQNTKLSITFKKFKFTNDLNDNVLKNSNNNEKIPIDIVDFILRPCFVKNNEQTVIPRSLMLNFFDTKQINFSGKLFIKNFTTEKSENNQYVIIQIKDNNIPFEYIKLQYNDHIYTFDKNSKKIVDHNGSWFLFFKYKSINETDFSVKISFENVVNINLNFILFSSDIFEY